MDRKTLFMVPVALAPGLLISSCASKGMDGFNVVYILADDLGYGDVGCYGQTKIQTPNIDRLASEGLLFTQHYAGCPVSAPSRSSLMTGLHTGHTPIRDNRTASPLGYSEGQYPMPGSTFTLGEMFHQADYVTGVFGKWGLGAPGSESCPSAMGIDEFYGYNCQALAHKYYPDHLWENDERVDMDGNDFVNKTTYSHDLIHSRALEFIRNNSDRKFFLMLAYTIPHAELLVPEDDIIAGYRGKFEETPYVTDTGNYSREGWSTTAYCSQPEPHATFAAMVTRLDGYVGDVMAALEEKGIRNKTLVIFTSDNGPHKEGGADPLFFNSSGGLRGIKRDVYEGGIRVPMIASCPGIVPQGLKTGHVSAFWDVLPTFADVAGVKLLSPVDGISFLPTLLGCGKQLEHEYLYWEFHQKGGRRAVRKGNWKAVQMGVKDDPDAHVELYDLSTDESEERDVSGQHPEIVEEMKAIFKEAHVPAEGFSFGEADE